MAELHVMIVWQNGRYREKDILADLSNSFSIKEKWYISWNQENAYKNFSRFYAIKSRYAKGKMKDCGSGEFLVIIFEDSNPKYDTRTTNSGTERVNANVFDKKILYRSWVGGSRIHATNSIQETSHNLALLFGSNYKNYYDNLPTTSVTHTVTQDLIGTNGWNSFHQLFNVLNECLEYTVLRNFEGFFDEMILDNHLDIDLLVRNYEEASLVLNGVQVFPRTSRVVNRVMIDKLAVDFDLRSLNDGYMDATWAEDLLATRIFNPKGFFRPAKVTHSYSLLYHALIHKNELSDDYLCKFKSKFGQVDLKSDNESRQRLINILIEYMKSNNYSIVEPSDLSVSYNLNCIEPASKVSIKRQLTYKYRSLKSLVKKCIS